MSITRIVRPFAGRDHAFDIAPLGIVEALERICDAGMGEIFARLEGTPIMVGEVPHRLPKFRHCDIRETIRLGLVGAGMPSQDATHLVMAEIDGRPIGDFLVLATAILTAYAYGVDDAVKKDDGSADAATATRPQPDRPTSDPAI